MQIQILSIKAENKPTKTPGKTTPALDIAFKNLTFQGKVEGKLLYSFGGNKGGYDGLLNAAPGEVYDIDVVKNTAGYNDWTTAKKSDGSGVATGSSQTATPSSTGKSFVPSKSTYPTDEERAKTQVYIVRQSNITAALNLLSVGAKAPPKIEDVIKTAKIFEDHVFGTSNDKVEAESPSQFSDLEDKDDFPDMPQ